MERYVIQMFEDVLAAPCVVPFLLTTLQYLHELVNIFRSFLHLFLGLPDGNII